MKLKNGLHNFYCYFYNFKIAKTNEILNYMIYSVFDHNVLFLFYSAAAYCRLEQYDLAIQDCRTALALEPKYAKAYGRMGFGFYLFGGN